MSSVVGEKGELVIEKPHVEIRFIPPEPIGSLHGILAPHVWTHLDSEQWNEIRSKAWVEAAGIAECDDPSLAPAPLHRLARSPASLRRSSP